MMPVEVMGMVADVCGVTVAQMQDHRKRNEIVFAKYITVVMLLEDNVPIKQIIGLFPNHDRITTIYASKDRFNDLIIYYKPFKCLYLECIRRLAIANDDL